MRTQIKLSVVVLTLLLPDGSVASTWRVDASGTPGVDCDCVTIQACVDSASSGDTVLVAPGTYGAVRIDGAVAPKDSIVLVSESGPDVTVVDGADTTSTIYCVALRGLVIQGFTITRGSPRGIDSGNCHLSIAGNVIRENADGGIHLWHSASEADIRDNVIENNGGQDLGGGILCMPSHATIENNIIRNNHAEIGGGLFSWARPIVVRQNLFEGNVASGGYYDWTAVSGSAIFCTQGDPTVSSNTIVANQGPFFADMGAQVEFVCFLGSCREMNVTFTNNVVAGNPDGYGVAASSCDWIEMSAECNDIWGNAAGNHGMWCGDSTGTAGNISEDPQFCDPDNGDYHLHCASPCAAENHPTGYPCGLIGAFGVGCGGSATERTTWGAVKAMYR